MLNFEIEYQHKLLIRRAPNTNSIKNSNICNILIGIYFSKIFLKSIY